MSSMFIIILITGIIKTTCFDKIILMVEPKEKVVLSAFKASSILVTFTRFSARVFRKVRSTSTPKNYWNSLQNVNRECKSIWYFNSNNTISYRINIIFLSDARNVTLKCIFSGEDYLCLFWQKGRSSCSWVFCKKGVLRNFVNFTGKHLYQSLFQSRFPVSFTKFLKRPIRTPLEG